jgi:hypothetical protein
MHQFVTALSLVLSFAACGSAGGRLETPSEPHVALGEEFTLKPGQSASVQDGALVVRFESVSNDSRCPRGATCIWEGDAVVAVSAHRGGTAANRHELHTSGRYAREASEGPFRIELVKLDPLPAEGTTVDAKDYVATFKVARE